MYFNCSSSELHRLDSDYDDYNYLASIESLWKNIINTSLTVLLNLAILWKMITFTRATKRGIQLKARSKNNGRAAITSYSLPWRNDHLKVVWTGLILKHRETRYRGWFAAKNPSWSLSKISKILNLTTYIRRPKWLQCVWIYPCPKTI
jgi:hypothetical protein